VERWWKVIEGRAMNPAHPLNPQRVLWELSSRLPENAMISCDCGTATAWYARNVKMKPSMIGSLSGTLLSMGSGVPYAVAAKFCHPDRPAIALVGDGAMQMNGIAELITAAKYWRRWEDPRLIVLVLNNRDLSFVTWEQRATAGDPRFEASQDLPDVPYAHWAETLGFEGIRVDKPDEVAEAWEEALAADRPVVYEAIVDAEVPPMPPHISFEQAKSMTRALYRGDPAAPEILRHAFAELVEEYIPHR
jgi:pyruvate dehydrogenase (quinone)